MNKLSVLILTKNEEANIVACLESIRQLADEIIIVDDFSEDRTLDIIKNYGSTPLTILSQSKDNSKWTRSKIASPAWGGIKIFQRALNNNFAEQRNYGLEKATGEWVLYVDADERITNSLRENIKYQIDAIKDRYSRLAGSSIKYQNISAYKLKRKNFYYGKHEWPKIERLERLFKKDKLKGWQGELHESPVIDGDINELEGYLLHYTHQDLSSMLDNTIKWSEIEANLRLKTDHPKMTWWRFPRVMITEFFNYYIGQKGWKLRIIGLIESLYQSFSIFITYARLWEKQKGI